MPAMSTTLLAAAMFAFVSTITPGPNNLMLAASGVAVGFRRTLPLVLGITVGFQALLWAVAAGLGALFLRLPALHWALKFVGAGYLLYLAWKLWRMSSAPMAATERAPGFAKGVVFQAVNPKAWMMTIGAVGAYTSAGAGYWPSVTAISALFLVLGLPCIAAWAAFGAALRASLGDERRMRLFGRGMAVLTGASCVLVFL